MPPLSYTRSINVAERCLNQALKKCKNGIKVLLGSLKKHDYFNFSIGNFPYFWRNIHSTPAYGDYVSFLIRYARAFSTWKKNYINKPSIISKIHKWNNSNKGNMDFQKR